MPLPTSHVTAYFWSTFKDIVTGYSNQDLATTQGITNFSIETVSSNYNHSWKPTDSNTPAVAFAAGGGEKQGSTFSGGRPDASAQEQAKKYTLLIIAYVKNTLTGVDNDLPDQMGKMLLLMEYAAKEANSRKPPLDTYGTHLTGVSVASWDNLSVGSPKFGKMSIEIEYLFTSRI